MGKHPDIGEKALLAVELLRRIPRRRKITAAELHLQLRDAGIERDLRTIQRQLGALSAHFRLDRDDRSKPYGYSWPEGSKGLAVPDLTPQESLFLRLAEEHLRNLLPARLMRSMNGLFSQARRNLDAAGPASLDREWPGKVRVVATSQPLLPPTIAPGVFEVTCDALYANLWLHIDYRNSAGRRAPAEVMPLGLAQQGQGLYLVCRYKGYNDDRMIALHRLLSARASTLAFERPKDFDLQRFDEEGRFGFGEGSKVRLTFRIDKAEGAHLLETPLSADQKVRELRDAYEVSATVVDSALLEWWLRGFGDAVNRISRTPVQEIGNALSHRGRCRRYARTDRARSDCC